MGSTLPPVAFIGLGAMGFGMATNLIRLGYPVTGFDVYKPTLDRFKEAGGQVATSPAEAVAGKQSCVCMVATAEQAQGVLFDGDNAAVPALPQGAALLLCSTVPCGYVQSLEQMLISKGRGDIALIDCPVSGGAGRAADGTLSIMAGGADASIQKSLSLLQAMSDPAKLYVVKGGIGAGSNMKMCHQVLAANQILSASEALGFASHLGLDLAKTSQAILKSEGWSWMFENRLPRLLHPEFQPVASAVTIILKDTSIITSEARRARFPASMTTAAEQVYFSSLSRGFGTDDDSSLLRLYIQGKNSIGPVKPLVETDEAKINLVVNLLRGIHVCAAAEAIAFAHHVGLDLDQVLELCLNAAGGSSMLSSFGRIFVDASRDGRASSGWTAHDNETTLQTLAQELRSSINEGQRLKLPLFLGTQAYNLVEGVLHAAKEDTHRLAIGSIISSWAA
ncbi:hypothetical protein CkaCkLH20_11537 [Colletotrichum karsti]|uniref:L-threonate dehydrogenase n=1 Tax=Colletotrichum karsti TaxID=1095194 RepID=A0A9P6I2R5_9PEZI|nr:uncharacterized protein CkaCkLH20_11537 [Colletotrichum karsti]KAF9870865.1 hypothetical protein CkaCkLH20_11537 [Colletotrichum karsti]